MGIANRENPQSPLRVLVLYNDPVLSPGHADYESEHDILATVDVVCQNLRNAGLTVSRLGMTYDPLVLLKHLREQPADVVFNLFEGTADRSETEAHLAGLLEWLQVPFTGSRSCTLTLAKNKSLTKSLFAGAGLPTPAFFAVEDCPVSPCRLRWPVIVKSALQDASVGLDHGSVVTDQRGLDERVGLLLESYGPPVLVEEYIAGRELNVAFIETPELRPLPISEVLFTYQDPSLWPIVTYDAKWKPGSRDYEATPPRYPADVAPDLAARLQELGRRVFRLLGCRDYARVDFRVAPSGEPFILEVNPNPDFSPSAGFAAGLQSAGINHAQFTVDLVRNALGRARSR